ncbi:hypothetical protein P3T76_001153 [Phytophthora citrophthora]|uniref:BED-type domain-containing protein n=1 Tax=Phytophthora citrophthora TaxID=4793 RepID=A0AAD9GZK4_9STRA|nr:hypothetical protein P3T76_001153 [Phytophthora citrophthora]
MELPSTATHKRTGRPVHPLWAHYHRGEKRNRYHYHAYCMYCVARHGADQVTPTRGVSIDMLRHLESCPNCPRKVVDTVRELCSRRERIANTKKDNSDHGVNGNEDQVLLLETADGSMQGTHTTIDNAADMIAKTSGGGDVHILGKRPASGMSLAHTTEDVSKRVEATDAQNTVHSMGDTARYLADGHMNDTAEDIAARWKTTLLQTAVAAGIPLSAFHKSEFQELLQILNPEKVDTEEIVGTVTSPAFLEETAAKLARSQLERVEEGMLNSSIKSGLTLSITCWRTLDLQYLVAFTLVNSNGDASCVRVEDLGGYHSGGEDSSIESPMSPLEQTQLLPLSRAIEDVLQDLSEKNSSVVGIVVDSAVALGAAKRVCRHPRWKSLLVLPCMSALLTSLAGTVLTNEAYRAAVGQLVELTAFFSNERLQEALRAMSGENEAHIPLPTRDHSFSFVACLTKALHYSDAITALCSSQVEGSSSVAPLALRELVLGNNCQLWKTLRELAVLLAPLREAYSLMFQSKSKLDGINNDYDNDDEYATTAHGGLTLAHVMYQLGRVSQQYSSLADSSAVSSSSNSSDGDITVVAQRIHEIMDTMWQRYDLPTTVLAYVFDFHMDTDRLDTSNSLLQWNSVSSYFQFYFRRWFCQPPENLYPISSGKLEAMLNAYQLRQFPFDTDTTNCYTDVSSFYSFVSDSHPELCALCCRVYAVALTCVDLRRLVRGIGFLPPVAQTTAHAKQVERLLHVGFATSLKRSRRSSDGNTILPQLLQASHPEELLCSQNDWEAFADDWTLQLENELAVDEMEKLHQVQGHSNQDKSNGLSLSLDQLFCEALPPLPAASVVAPSPHDPSGSFTHASVAL